MDNTKNYTGNNNYFTMYFIVDSRYNVVFDCGGSLIERYKTGPLAGKLKMLKGSACYRESDAYRGLKWLRRQVDKDNYRLIHGGQSVIDKWYGQVNPADIKVVEEGQPGWRYKKYYVRQYEGDFQIVEKTVTINEVNRAESVMDRFQLF